MQISHVRIHNFRSVKDLELVASSRMIFLGPNNHGKSNVLSAIDFVLSPSFKLDEDDFFAFRPDDDRGLWVEITFVDLTEQERRTFAKYLQADGSVTIRRMARMEETGAADTKYQGYVEEPSTWWLTESAFDRLNTQDLVRAETQAVPVNRPGFIGELRT